MGSWVKALRAAEVVLSDDKYNIKSIYVKAEALFNLCLFEHSLVHFHRGLVIIFYNPSSFYISIGEDIFTESSNVITHINNVCNLISVSTKQFN